MPPLPDPVQIASPEDVKIQLHVTLAVVGNCLWAGMRKGSNRPDCHSRDELVEQLYRSLSCFDIYTRPSPSPPPSDRASGR